MAIMHNSPNLSAKERLIENLLDRSYWYDLPKETFDRVNAALDEAFEQGRLSACRPNHKWLEDDKDVQIIQWCRECGQEKKEQ